MANIYQKGDLVRVTASFTNSAGSAIDPTGVVFRTKLSTTTTSYTFGVDGSLIKDSIGNYHIDVNANAVGTWYYRWEGTGTGQAAEESAFEVESRF